MLILCIRGGIFLKIDINNLHIPRWNELPSIDLYLDQIVTLINSTLSPYIFFGNIDDKNKENLLLSKTMINNYVKHNLIEAPIKKKYSKIQIAKVVVSCVLKQVFSMDDINKLISIALKESDIVSSYNSFCEQFEKALKATFNKENLSDTYSSNNANKYLLNSVLFSCSYKIYITYTLTKTTIESKN